MPGEEEQRAFSRTRQVVLCFRRVRIPSGTDEGGQTEPPQLVSDSISVDWGIAP